MVWDFETEPEFEEKLQWIREFKKEYIEPIDLVYPGRAFFPLDEETGPLVEPLKQEVRDQGLWAAHLGPELGGKGYGQLKLALINEILGTSSWAPIIFGTAAPDTGNAEIIAHYGTDAQKEKYLQPLLDGECFSCYSMTEPHAGADPKMFKTRAERDGDEWVINGWKYFSSNARTARFIIVMAVTNPDVSPYQGMSMFLVPTDTPGLDVVRHIGLHGRAPRTRACTPSSTTTTSASRPRTCSAVRARPSPSPRPGSAAAASTTPCARWACARRRST